MASPQRGAQGSPYLEIRFLDVLRGLAALYVMLGHARWLLWSGQKEFASAGVHGIGYLLGFASAGLTYGHQAVILFFLISGFCIHFRQARATVRDEHAGATPRASLNLQSYAFRRFRRLYPPLVLALGLTAAFDYLGGLINPEYYAGHTLYPFINAAVAGSHGVGALLGNLLFQSGLVSPTFGTDGPLWSLAYEFWFYVLYPVLVDEASPQTVETEKGARPLGPQAC